MTLRLLCYFNHSLSFLRDRSQTSLCNRRGGCVSHRPGTFETNRSHAHSQDDVSSGIKAPDSRPPGAQLIFLTTWRTHGPDTRRRHRSFTDEKQDGLYHGFAFRPRSARVLGGKERRRNDREVFPPAHVPRQEDEFSPAGERRELRRDGDQLAL